MKKLSHVEIQEVAEVLLKTAVALPSVPNPLQLPKKWQDWRKSVKIRKADATAKDWIAQPGNVDQLDAMHRAKDKASLWYSRRMPYKLLKQRRDGVNKALKPLNRSLEPIDTHAMGRPVNLMAEKTWVGSDPPPLAGPPDLSSTTVRALNMDPLRAGHNQFHNWSEALKSFQERVPKHVPHMLRKSRSGEPTWLMPPTIP